MKVVKNFALAIVLSLSFSFVSFAGEGMIPSNYPEDVWTYSYAYEDGTYAENEWKQVWDDWYYFGEDGKSKYNTWAEIDEKWYYFDSWSRMLHDTTTPDGYQVGPDGAMIVEETAPQQAETAAAVETQTRTAAASATKPQSWSAKYPYVDGMTSDSANCKYVVNTNTGKVHKPGCSSVKDMTAGNTQYYSGEFSALTAGGYASCGRCHAK